MKSSRTRRGTVVVCAALLALMGASTAAHADDQPRQPDKTVADWLDVDYDPTLSPDALITDDMENQSTPLGSTVTCTNESVQTGPNPAPASPSFQLLYVVPSGVTPNSRQDVPQSCSDGSIRYSNFARGSRNLATWQYNQNAGLNYRTINIAYTHNYTSQQYPTRGVRRFSSPTSKASWESLSMSGPNNTSPRLDRLRTELFNNGFKVANTKYMALLDTAAQRGTCTTSGTTTTCHYTVGVADIDGPYGLTTRQYTYPSGSNIPPVTIRYGCGNSDGDAFLGHESTHMVGANHVTDNSKDLMVASKPQGVSFNTSPSLIWDYGRNSYHATVRANPYVVLSNLAGSYFTC